MVKALDGRRRQTEKRGVAQRLVFINPLADISYGRTLYQWLTRRTAGNKYSYLIPEALAKGYRIGLFVNRSSIPLTYGGVRPNSLWLRIEFVFWALLNGFNPLRFFFVDQFSQLKSEDAVFLLAFGNHVALAPYAADLAASPARKTVHLTHYMVSTEKVAHFIQACRFDVFLAEANLCDSAFFRKYFPFVQKVEVLPFVFQSRFFRRIPFGERKRKCVAVGVYGSLDKVPNLDEFRSFFSVDCYHPMRKEIYLHRESVNPEIEVFTGSFQNEKMLSVSQGDPAWVRFIKKIYNNILMGPSKYYSFSMPDVLNQYQLMVCPEEISHLPGIGFVEGMASGCAYIGIRSNIYEEVGLKPEIHYISYDGTLSDLIERIRYYQNHPQEMQEIAENGERYVREKFSAKSVFDRFEKMAIPCASIPAASMKEMLPV